MRTPVNEYNPYITVNGLMSYIVVKEHHRHSHHHHHRHVVSPDCHPFLTFKFKQFGVCVCARGFLSISHSHPYCIVLVAFLVGELFKSIIICYVFFQHSPHMLNATKRFVKRLRQHTHTLSHINACKYKAHIHTHIGTTTNNNGYKCACVCVC